MPEDHASTTPPVLPDVNAAVAAAMPQLTAARRHGWVALAAILGLAAALLVLASSDGAPGQAVW